MVVRQTATVADGIAQTLMEEGVRHMFGMPGGGANTDLVEAAGRAGLEFVLCHTETAAGFAASAYAELSGTPGVFLTTLGPGVASACNAVAHCTLDRDPVLLISDCHPHAFDGLEHQRFDHARVLAPLVKRSVSLDDDVEGTVRSLLNVAVAGQPGPVHLDVAPDITPRPWEPAEAGGGKPKSVDAPGVQVDAALELLRRAKRPIVIAGLGIRGERAAAALRSFAEARQMPVLTTYKGKGAFPDAHPLHAGIMTGGTLEEPLVAEADLIIAAGMDPVELIPRRWPYSAPVVFVGEWAHNARHFEATSLLGDVAGSIGALGQAAPGESAWDLAGVAAQKREMLARLRCSSGGLSPTRVVELTREATAGDPVVSVDAGAHMFPATNFWSTSRPNRFLISNGLASMGYALPAAIAAAVLEPDERVICFTGDGGLCMCLGELETAARLGLKIQVVVFDDSTLSLIKIKQDQKGFQPAGVGFRLDWGRLAEGFGCAYFAASDETSYLSAWRQSLNVDGPSVIAARIDPSGYGAMLAALRS
ncbi:MAG: thiamine pyrophosphate-binding protein [Chloroflexi bacterium]|nr:thiamine pyrophosphate-binding protein [Chloroflexota bacterium]